MKLIADCHIHSNTSPDAVDSIDDICQSAIDKGLKYICITNHHEIFPGEPTPTDYLLDFKKYDIDISKARDKYSDKLDILKGVEFGGPHQHPKEYEAILSMDFDMIIASLHFMPLDFGIHWLWGGNEMMMEEGGRYFVQRYYEEMVKLTAMAGFQVLAHLDWPKSHNKFFAEIEEVDAEIFKNLLKNNSVPEINTKAFAKGCAEFHPSPSILAQYQDLGGTRLVVGSDAHKKEDIAADFTKVETYLDNHDFEVGYFKNKKFMPLQA